MTRSAARRGVALILVLWLVVVLGLIAARVVGAARVTTTVAANVRARTVARYAAESGAAAVASEIEDSLAALATDPTARRAYLNRLERAPATAAAVAGADVSLGDARFRVAIVEPSARLDVNAAGVETLEALFARLAGPLVGRQAARAVQRAVGAEGVRGGGAAPVQGTAPGRALRTLDDLRRVPGVPATLAVAAAPYLTVDGDGTVNRATAAEPVRAAARGSLVDEPTRIVLVSRGWLAGHPLTHEIQAVYAVRGDRLAFVRWRERDL